MDISAVGRSPIPGPSPAGHDARYDSEYTDLQAEIDKLNSVTRVGEVEWGRVVDLAAVILSTKAKDLLAAAYLSIGLMQTEGFGGFVTGTQVLRDLVTTYWDDCFPAKTRLRGRMNALIWWQEKTIDWLKAQSASEPVPAMLHGEAVANIKGLDQGLADLLPDLPSMRELLGQLERLPQENPQPPGNAPEADRPAVGNPSSPQAVSGGQTPSVSADTVAPLQDAKAARKVLGETALGFAALGWGENPADPWIWKASRLAAWINIKELPPSMGGQTMVPAPEVSVKGGALSLLAEGKLLEAARVAEEYFTGAIFWLDLQCIIAKALTALGDDYAQALASVCGEVGLFVQRFPGIEQLSFADGTPFADVETRNWLISLRSGPPKETLQGSPPRDQSVSKVLEEAGAYFAKKNEAVALDLISQAILKETEGPTRVRLRLGQIALLCRSNHFAMAAALADELLAEIEARELEDWLPSLVVDVALGCREVFLGLGGETNLAKARALAAKVSRIRPSAALNLAI